VRYLEIKPGLKGVPIPEGGTLAGHETTAVALDEVLSTFDPTTRDRTGRFLRELGNGLGGRGTDVNDALRSAPGLVSRLGHVAAEINVRAGAPGRMVASSQAFTQALDPVRQTIADGFDPEARAMQPFARRREDLRETFVQAAPAMRTLRDDLPAVSRLVAQVDGLAREGLPTLQLAPSALARTTQMLRVGKAPLGAARRTLELADRAVDPTLKLLRTLTPVLPRIDRAVTSLSPTVKYMAPRACELGHAWQGWGEWLKWGNDYNNFIRFEAYVGQPDGLAGFLQVPGGKPGEGFFDAINRQNSYPGPCDGQIGEAGDNEPLPEISAKGLPFNGRTP
jgi:phospholipid/cholesterol/gamma-HCH transport system substrate-binding protein